jgi:hypothetical protein
MSRDQGTDRARQILPSGLLINAMEIFRRWRVKQRAAAIAPV